MDEIKAGIPTEGTGTEDKLSLKDKTVRWAHRFASKHPKLIRNCRRGFKAIVVAGTAVVSYKAGQKSVKPTEVAVVTEEPAEPQPEIEAPQNEEPTETTTE